MSGSHDRKVSGSAAPARHRLAVTVAVAMTLVALVAAGTLIAAATERVSATAGPVVAGEVIGPDTVIPSPQDDRYSTLVNTRLLINAPGVIANDTDVVRVEVFRTVASGSLILGTTGGFLFEPATGFTGDVTFDYLAYSVDGVGIVATATITVTPLPSPSPTPPVNQGPSITLGQGSLDVESGRSVSLRFTVSDPDDAAETIVVSVRTPSRGTASVSGTGADRTLTYTAAAGGSGFERVTIDATDGRISTSATVDVRIASPDLPGISLTVDGRASGPLDLVPGQTLTYRVSYTSGPSSLSNVSVRFAIAVSADCRCGSAQGLPVLSAAADQSGTITVDPAVFKPGRVLVATLDYRRSLPGGGSEFGSVASVGFAYSLPNAAPTITGLDATGSVVNVAGQTYSDGFSIADDRTPAGDLQVTVMTDVTTGTAGGIASVSGTGADRTLSFAPTPGSIGTVRLVVTVSDGALSFSQTVTVTLGPPPNSAPVVDAPETLTTDEDTLGQIPFTVSDAETAAETLLIDAAADHGEVTITRTGDPLLLTYRPAADFHGVDTVTLTVSDGELTTMTTVPVTVRPVNDPPVIDPSSVPAASSVEGDVRGGAAVTFATPTATDVDAGGATVAVACTAPLGAGGADVAVVSGATVFPIGTTTVTCTAVDAVVPDTATPAPARVSFAVTVADSTAPVLTVAPDVAAVEATGPDGAAVTFAAPTATDLVAGDLDPVCVRDGTDVPATSGGTFPVGITTVRCTVTDGAGNRATATFTVTVQDTVAPTLAPIAAIPPTEATGPDGAPVTFPPPIASDIADPAPAVTCIPNSGTRFGLGETTVSCRAIDAAANVSVAVAGVVTVVDTTSPVLDPATLPGTDLDGVRVLTVRTDGSTAAVRWAPVTASDAVAGPLTLACVTPGSATPVPPAGVVFTLGDTLVTCTVSDGRSAPLVATFTVRVIDGGAPVITVGAGGVRDGQIYARRQLPPAPTCTAVDAVDGPVTCSVSGYGTTFGSHTVTLSATDGSGNTASETVTYTVADRAAVPTATPPPPTTAPAPTMTPRPRSTPPPAVTPPPTATPRPSDAPPSTATPRPTPRPRR